MDMKISIGSLLFLHLLNLCVIITAQSNPNPLPPAKVMGFPISIVKDVRSPPQKNGEYNYEIVLTDGTMIKQAGNLGEKPNGSPDFQPFLIITGEYSYTDPQGKSHKVTYVADKNGFRPIIDGTEVVGQTSFSTPIPIVPEGGSQNQPPVQQPLNTISSSLFSSPSRFF